MDDVEFSVTLSPDRTEALVKLGDVVVGLDREQVKRLFLTLQYMRVEMVEGKEKRDG